MRSADKPGADCLLAVKVDPASPSTACDVERIKHGARLSESAGIWRLSIIRQDDPDQWGEPLGVEIGEEDDSGAVLPWELHRP